MPVYEVIIPYRDRGIDPLRAANLAAVLAMWEEYGYSAYVVSDGRAGRQQFNRSAAYNNGVRMALEGFPDLDGFIFAEADMLIDADQVDAACELADKAPGLVIPFDAYHYLSPENSMLARGGVSPAGMPPQWVMRDGKSIGAINVVSRSTMRSIGQWDEKFEGNWYDDDAMKIAFDLCCGPTRFIEGPAWHLHHLPGHKGEHLTPEDKRATRLNKIRLGHYEYARRINSPDRIRQLTGGDS